MIVYYVPCKDKKEARKIATKLLKDKLIACANFIQSESIYEWEGKINEEPEIIMLLKTIETNGEEVQKIIKEMHSYEVPAIIRLTAIVNDEYLTWMQDYMKES